MHSRNWNGPRTTGTRKPWPVMGCCCAAGRSRPTRCCCALSMGAQSVRSRSTFWRGRASGLAAQGISGLLLIWDNASWHKSQQVRDWLGLHNRTVKQTGEGVRIVACLLPSKSPWLNPIEPSGCMANGRSRSQTACSAPTNWRHGSTPIMDVRPKLIWSCPKRLLDSQVLRFSVLGSFTCRPARSRCRPANPRTGRSENAARARRGHRPRTRARLSPNRCGAAYDIEK